MKYDVTIIVPLYNSINYIDKLITQLKNINYKSYAVILVDDGSVDETLKVVNENIKNLRNFSVLQKKNGGISSARNLGLLNAKSDFIMFIDHDDEFDSDIIEKNIIYFKQYNVDLIKFGVERSEINIKGKSKIYYDSFGKNRLIDKTMLEKDYINLRNMKVFSYVWNGIYKRKILCDNNIKFNEELRFGGEDSAFNYQYLLNVNSIYVNNSIYYNYKRITGNSTSTIYNQNRIFSLTANFCYELELVSRMSNFKNIIKYLIYRYVLNLFIILLKNKLTYSERRVQLEDFRQLIIKSGVNHQDVLKYKKIGLGKDLLVDRFFKGKYLLISIMIQVVSKGKRL